MTELTAAQRGQLRELEQNFTSALSLHEAGKLDEARLLYEHVLEVVPGHGETLDLYGRLLFQQGEHDRSLTILRQAVSIDAPSPSRWNHLGAALHQTGAHEEAILAFRHVIQMAASHVDAHINLAIVLGELGRDGEALEVATIAATMAPDQSATRLRLGVFLKNVGRYDEAIGELEIARSLDPLVIEIYLNLSSCHHVLGNRQSRLDAVRRGMMVAPASHEIYTHFSGTGSVDKREFDFIAWARRGTRLRPFEHRMWDQLTAEYFRENQFVETMDGARRSMLLAPDEAGAYNNLATGRFNTGDYDGSIWAARVGLCVAPDLAEIAYILCQSAFSGGSPDLGWRYWSSRYRMNEAPSRIGLPALEWKPGVACDGSLLVCAEQGVGDEILYLSCLPDLLADVGKVVVECDARWQRILEFSFPDIATVPRQMRHDEAGKTVHDYRDIVGEFGVGAYVLCGTLPEYYRRDILVDPPRGGYLRPDPEEIQAWRVRLESLGSGPFIGVCWRSGLAPTLQRTMFYPDAVELISQLPHEDCTLISLQYGDRGDDLERVRHDLGVHVHDFQDLDQMRELEVDAVGPSTECEKELVRWLTTAS
jgi:tetratricopeptide (TPR) repeat protein